jgi:hypothetical protein
MLKRLNILLVLGLLWTVQAQAATRYAGQGGGGTPSDANSCAASVTKATRKLTIGAGIGCMVAGDTLIITDGTYNEVINNTIPSGTVGAHTIVQAENQYGAILQPSTTTVQAGGAGRTILYIHNRNYITVDGLVSDAILSTVIVYHIGLGEYNTTVPTSNITIKNMEVKNGVNINNQTTSMGIVTSPYVTDLLIQNNTIHDIAVTGSNVAGGWSGYCVYTKASDSIWENNHFHHCGGWGFHGYNTTAGKGSGNIIRNNKFNNNGHYANPKQPGVLLAASGSNNQFYGNLIYENGSQGLQLGGYGGVSNTNKVYNNTIYGNLGTCIRMGNGGVGGTSNDVRNNICYGNGNNTVEQNAQTTPTVSNNPSTNPLFINAGADNFHLNTNSPAIDAGVNLTATVATDFDGIAHTVPMEVGAFSCCGVEVLPVSLIFTTQPPGQTVAGATMASVTVCAIDSASVLQTSYVNAISLALQDQSGAGTLTGGTGGAATAGCRSFTGLSINNAAVGYSLLPSGTGATGVESVNFDIITEAESNAPRDLKLEMTP